MYCPRCGEANEESARFCSGCGQDLTVYQQLWHTAGQSTPTTQAPRYRPATPAGPIPRIPSYLGWAIAVLILCFWPTGIPAVVYASQVDNKLAFGDVSGAQESSRRARMWCWITFGIGVAIWVISLVLVIWFSWLLATRHIDPSGFHL
jgi:hypothetical protein